MTTIPVLPAVAPDELVRPLSGLVTRSADGAAVLVAENDVLRRPDSPVPHLGVHEERLHELFEKRCDATPDHLAVDAPDGTGRTLALTFAELDARADRLARHLRERGARPGDRIALLLEHPVDAYTAEIAVSKLHATYVPLDVGFPADRIAYILADAGVTTVVTAAAGGELVAGLDVRIVRVDTDASAIAARDARRPTPAETDADAATDTDLAYIIYTSGSTGRPKGVAVEHGGVTAFLRVAAAVYGLRPGDRVYQGMTIAFDFSLEELWVPWTAGATVVPKPAGEPLLGADLTTFLVDHEVTALCCVPTLLATLEADELARLRFLLVSGEACPSDLVARWYRPDRRFLNVYGPTEATVTATWTELHPDRGVTIGVPLPGYAIVVLDPDDPTRVLPRGETGEIGIAGIGLARGYVNREERTRESFVADELGLGHVTANPTGRLYRTGDLGRIDDHGEIEYHGRIDLQVKIRGYRIELTEVESVLLGVPGVAAAVVATHEPEPGVVELVGYYTERPGHGGTADLGTTIREQLAAELPAAMVPTYLERLDAIPLTTNDKADRANLPAPTGRRAAPEGEHVAPATVTEERLAEVLAAALGGERPSVTADVFTALGLTSLLAARFTARVRDEGLGSLSLREVYHRPTVRGLAVLLDERTGTAGDTGDTGDTGAPTTTAEPHTADARAAARPVAHALFGTAQTLLLLAGAAGLGLLLDLVSSWLATAEGFGTLVARGVAATAIGFAGLCVAPVAAKWLLVGRWHAREVPLWGVTHLRLWLVKSLSRLSPLTLLVGTPLPVLHLRALGARVGRDVVVLTRRLPVATDLVSIGDGTVVRDNATLAGYRALPGRLQLGPVTLGADVVVGERAVLDVGTAVGDGATLGHSSALPAGTTVPAGETWHGSPAEPTDTDYRTVPGGRTGARGTLRRAAFGAVVLLAVLAGAAALLTGAVWVWNGLAGWTATVGLPPTLAIAAGVGVTLGIALLLLLLRLAVALAVPRLLAPLVAPGRPHPLHGVAHLAHLASAAAANAPFVVLLLGDSSFVVGYLRALGYHLRPVEQTGSNFGTQLRQDAPALTRIGTGTMVSDGLRVANASWSSTAFRVDPVTVGERTFLGNDVVVPPGARLGDNCLLATKVGVPLDGPVRHDVGLLGSPAFTIPRARPRDPSMDELGDPAVLRRRLAAKDRHNALSVVTLLLARGALLGVGLLVAATTVTTLEPVLGAWAFAVATAAALVAGALLTVLFERAATGFRRLRPAHCSIYHPTFWRHERLWKLYLGPILAGSVPQAVLLRLAGVRSGRRVLDDGCTLPEKSLVTLGDDVVLNEGSVIQGHSLEDGLFTRDAIEIGSRSVLGVGAFVHYGVTVGPGTTIGADAFLMKGERTAAGSTWSGNPAEPSREPSR